MNWVYMHLSQFGIIQLEHNSYKQLSCRRETGRRFIVSYHLEKKQKAVALQIYTLYSVNFLRISYLDLEQIFNFH